MREWMLVVACAAAVLIRPAAHRDVRADDAVPIVTTAHGVGRLQQFTNDKAALKEAVARVQVSMLGIEPGGDLGASDEDKESADLLEEDQQAGTLTSVENVIRGMRDFPGRKSIVFVTSGFSLIGTNHAFPSPRTFLLEKFNRLVDEGNRSFVTIHTLDMRGVANPVDPNATTAVMYTDDQLKRRSSQDGPMLLADMGGGLSFAGSDFVRGIEQALDDQEGYYVLAYQPEGATFRKSKSDAAAFHAIKVRVKPSGLNVRTRSGFFGVTDEDANLLHFDGPGLSFAKGDDGQYRAPVEVLAMMVDGRGAAVETKLYTFALHSEQEPTAAKLDAGFDASVDITDVKPGAYQLRLAGTP